MHSFAASSLNAPGAPTKAHLARSSTQPCPIMPRNLGGAFKSEAVFVAPGAPTKPRVRIAMADGDFTARNLQDAFVECLEAPWAPARNPERLGLDKAEMPPRRLFH